MKRSLRLAIGITAAALLLAGCTAEPTGTDPTDPAEVAEGFLAVADESLPTGGALSVYLDYDSVEVNGVDPQTAETARSWMLMSLAYETLVDLDENFEPVPALAESWEVVSPTEYVFTLRDDAQFSNGRTVTPEDVKGTIERLKEIGGSWAGQIAAVESVEVTGDNEVTFTLSAPSTPLLGALAHVATAVLPMAEIESGEVDITQEMVGAGPYIATDHVQDESWTFEKNPDYFAADDVSIDTLDVKIVPDEANRLAGIRDGSADYAFFNNPDALDLLAGTPEAAAVSQQNTDFFFLILNSQNPDSPLYDPAVRLAVNAAVDREQIAEIAFGGTAVPTGLTPFALPDACVASDVPSAQMTDEEIRQTFEDAGLDGSTLSLITWNSEVGPGAIAQVIQQQLAEYGVELELEIVDGGVWGDALYGESAEPMADDLSITWYAGYGDASMVTNWWNTEINTFSHRYMGGSPEINELIVEGAETEPGAARHDVFTDLCGAVDEISEGVPLVNRPGVIAYRTDAVSPTINTNEGYGDILRFLSEYRMVGQE
ncbi:UNVERIFIED_CONTAM: ABC transporter substrate-binding protein [Microbacterium sp. SLM126]